MTLSSRRSDGRGGLEAGRQDQGSGADQVLQRPVQGREDQRQRAAQPVDDAGTLFNQVRLAGGEELQLRRDLIAGGSGCKSQPSPAAPAKYQVTSPSPLSPGVGVHNGVPTKIRRTKRHYAAC